MATFLEHLAARVAYQHAQRVYRRFVATLGDLAGSEQRALRRALSVVRGSELARRHGLDRVRSIVDLRRALPLMTYDDYRPIIDRVCDGAVGELFSRGTRLHMFATSSGTTAAPKRVPVTGAFVEDYRRGWNTFGLKMLSDHPEAVLRAILQSSGRHDVDRTPAGVPCGAITGLLARTQKRIVRRFYVGRPEIAHIDDPSGRYYALMRLGVQRDVAFAVTANPATLIQMARTADEQSETLIRDVRDGTLTPTMVPEQYVRQVLSAKLRPDPARAAELERLRAEHGQLRPRDYWSIAFVACWIGGSLGHYLQRLRQWWGEVPVRDVGLLASEGRVSIPLEDNTPVGVLDVTSGVFEFIPADQEQQAQPETLGPAEVVAGGEYVVVLSNTSGLLRYRLGDVVRVHGRLGATPLVEFLHRAGRVASVAGEKLTEHQVTSAVQMACEELGIAECDFIIAPRWDDPPHYVLRCTAAQETLAPAVDGALCRQNEEYASRRRSQRLGPLVSVKLAPVELAAWDRRLRETRRGAAEQFKRPCLLTTPEEHELHFPEAGGS